ncbi:MAG TPA: asparagine synthase (glutamine-hydrolyzing) [Terriglobales bacterium]|nr:asparagine synthase (glutamine-hydrolyzing) [Terriglobales bacterium]
MCGIAGQFRFDGAPVASEELGAMTRSLGHRGPDGVGCHINGNIGLAMTRLAIIDVAGGQQPIFNERNNLAIICNGEIYNYAFLRSQLEQRGHVFRTHSDVEVILHLYEDYGTDCFGHLNGMFGVAIADFEQRKLVLARDRCGQKPLYLWRRPQFIAFASELKALTGLPDFPSKPSGEALTSYLAFRYVPAPLSIFQGVEKLPPGSYLSVDKTSRAEVRRYWQIDLSDSACRSSSAGTTARDALMSSVERHLMSERPLGVFLSGGLDSSAIVACMHLSGHRDIRTYTVGFDGFLENEFENARRVAEHFKTSHEEVLLTADDFWNSLDAMVYSADEPLADLTAIPLYHLAKRARKDVVVVLSGEGSDELLAGYRSLRNVRQTFDLLHAARPFSPLARLLLRSNSSGRFLRRLRAVTESDADYLARSIYSYLGIFDPQFRQKYGAELANCGDPLQPVAEYYKSHPGWHGLNLTLGAMMEWWLPDDLLHKADRMTMAHSVELRCPFLDADFIEYCAGLRLSQKITAWRSEASRKIVLKKAFANVLPEGIVYQRKKGFVIPVYEWLRDRYAERARTELARPDGLASCLFGSDLRMELMDQAVAGDEPSQHRVWSLIILNKWGDHWM